MSNLSIWDAGAVFAMGSAPDGGSPWVQFVPFAIVLAIFYFIILLPMKRKQQKVAQFLDSLKVNDRIVTTGGIYGQITRLGDQTVQVQIADKVRIEVAKAAIGGYQGQDPVQEAVAERTSQ
jgi:preprotein translocase subunit YajC